MRGAKCFQDLRVFNGTTYATYKEAWVARGLLDDDHMQDEIMKDAATYLMPRQLRQTFVLLLLWDEPADPLKLWKKYAEAMALLDYYWLWLKHACAGAYGHDLELPNCPNRSVLQSL